MVVALTNMLNDRRPAHCARALWLVDAVGLVDVVGQICELAISDTDGGVRQRVGCVIKHLIQLLEAGSPIMAVPTRRAIAPRWAGSDNRVHHTGTDRAQLASDADGPTFG